MYVNMSSKTQEPESRLFNDDEFLQLCKDSGNDQLNYIPKGYSYNENRILTRRKTIADDYVSVKTHTVPRNQFTGFMTVPDQLTPSSDGIFDRIEESGDPYLDNELSETTFVNSISDSNIDSEQENVMMANTTKKHQEDNQPILASIDGQTGEFCVHMGGHLYPIEVGEFEPSTMGAHQYYQAAQSGTVAACRRSDISINELSEQKNIIVNYKHVQRTINRETVQVNESGNHGFHGEPRDCTQQRTFKHISAADYTFSDFRTVRQPPSCAFQDICCDNGSGFRDREFHYLPNTFNNDHMFDPTNNPCEEKWFDDFAQYSYAYGAYYCEQYKPISENNWEPNYQLEAGTNPHTFELPPVEELLPQSDDSAYVSCANILRHDVNLTDLCPVSNCSIYENRTNFAPQNVKKSAARNVGCNMKNRHGNCRSYQQDTVAIRTNKEMLSYKADNRQVKQASSNTSFRRDSITAEMRKRMKKMKRGCRLWEFIRNLLLDPSTNPSLIRWENRAEGTFKLVQSKAIAYKWGMKKGNECMTYEKLSRAMRYYYKRQVFQPVLGKRLVYRFGPRATGWKGD